MKTAAPATIDRRITGVTVTARRHGTEAPEQATKAAREALKPMKLDEVRTARGRGKAIAATPAHPKAMNPAPAARPQPRVGRRRGTQELPELARLRYRALTTPAFGIAGRSEEVSSLDTEGITQVGYPQPTIGPAPMLDQVKLRTTRELAPGPLAQLQGQGADASHAAEFGLDHGHLLIVALMMRTTELG